MTASALDLWHDYFITVAQVSATLAGLLFVGLTISLDHVLTKDGYMNRGFVALFLQLEMLIVGVFGIVPGQPVWLLGGEFVLAGLGILIGTSIFAHNFREDDTAILGSRGPRTMRRILAIMATLAPVLAGAGLIVGWMPALYFLVPAEIACLYLSVGNAWVFAVEIPRRMRRDAQ